MKHVPVSILAIVAIVGVTILMLSVNLYPETVIFAISYLPAPTSPSGDTIIINLDIGEYISNELAAVGEAQLAALAGGTVHAKDLSTDFTQSMQFSESGIFPGGHVAFGKDEQNRVSDFIQFDSGDGLFKYQVDFGSGLRSSLTGNKMEDIVDEDIRLLGETFTIVNAEFNTGSTAVELRLFGGFGSIDLFDGNSADDNYQSNGAKVNGKSISSLVKIKATMSGGKPTIYSIQYVPLADAVQGGNVYVLPLHCLRQYLQNPAAMLVPNFDICYKGLGASAVGSPSPKSISGNEVRMKTVGGDEVQMSAANLRGQIYKIPVSQLPGMYGNKGRNFVFVEAPAPGAPNINLHDYFLVSSKNDVNGVSNVLQYDTIDTTNHQVVFRDLAGSSRDATYDAGTMEGQLLVGEGTYKFVIGAGNSLAMDQTNNGAIAGNEAVFVLPGGSRIDFGPGFTVKVITPSRLFSDPMGDETTNIILTFGSYAGFNIPSPQTTVPGYMFNLESETPGVRQGLTKWGILFTWNHDNNADDLKMTVPGAYSSAVKGGATGNVYITFNPKLKKQQDVPAGPPKCGDSLITKPEYCDPPGSPCADQFKRTGVCAPDCLSCTFTAPTQCGNHLLEAGEDCEATADCISGYFCDGCKCKPVPLAMCGNNLLERGEQCEAAVDCGPGYNCINCGCSPIPQVQAPAPVSQPNIIARFFAWLARLFGSA